MAAIDTTALIARNAGTIAKRNWAGKEAGVIVVFCIIFIVGVGLVGFWLHKTLSARRALKASKTPQ